MIRAKRLALLKRYGWGIPRDEAVRSSTLNAVTLVTQDEFVPFQGESYEMRAFRFHRLPWPADVLAGLGETTVQLRVTLSYFVEPSAASRGWRRRYAYASHGLRFELSSPDDQTNEDFMRRVNREARREEEGVATPGGGIDWMIGPNQRNVGSLHQDVWIGNGGKLAACGVLGVYPVGGWWKNSHRLDRMDLPCRYALVISLRTPAEEVDLYTPIAIELDVPVEAASVTI